MNPPRTAIEPRPGPGFSLIELMVAMALMSFIVIGLLAMFNQTQRAFRTSITQTDVLESGRAAMDIMARELEQASPSESTPWTYNGQVLSTTNFFVERILAFNPLVQDLPGTDPSLPRVNVIQRFFFLTKLNQDWLGTGYEVVPDYFGAGVGALYRVGVTNARWGPITNSAGFLNARMTNYSKVVDGIVHLRARAFDAEGRLISWWMTRTNYPKNVVAYGDAAPPVYDPNQIACYFTNNAMPATVELEFGILEQQVLQRYRALGNAPPGVAPAAAGQLAQRRYLTNHAAQVHLFRQRIPIRNADLSVYQVP